MLGLRYIPESDFTLSFNDGISLDVSLALNLSATNSKAFNETSTNLWEGKCYRVTMRYNTPYSETRAGMQKINFGPAQVLRAEQWFDSLDPRDPLSLTDGIWGIVHRRYFRNNANIWIWGLYGNKDLKGIEISPTSKHKPEWGTRVQVPVLGGSTALTMHNRALEATEVEGAPSECMIAVDGRWDYGAGYWFEAVAAEVYDEGSSANLSGHRTFLTLGLDYTFVLGNGIYVIGEIMNATVGDEWFDDKTTRSSIWAMGSAYSIGFNDRLSIWVIRSPEAGTTSWISSLSHTRGNWTVQLSVFSYPENIEENGDGNKRNAFEGEGAQLNLIFDH